MAVPSTVPTFVAGNKLTAAQLNSGLRDGVNFLVTPPAVKVHNSSAQSIPTAAWTALTWDTEDLDSDTMHSTASNTHLFTAVTAGWYMITANVEFPINSTGQRLVRIADQSAVALFAGDSSPANASTTVTLSCSALVFLTVGSGVQAQVYQSSGGALSMGSGAGATTFSAVWMHS